MTPPDDLLQLLGPRELRIVPAIVDGKPTWQADVRLARRVLRRSYCDGLDRLVVGVVTWLEGEVVAVQARGES